MNRSMVIEGLILLAMGTVFLLIVRSILRERDRYFTLRVRNTSRRYKALIDLNKTYRFDDRIIDRYQYVVDVDTKQQFDRFNFDQFMRKKIEEDLGVYENIVEIAYANQNLLTRYRAELMYLPERASADEAKRRKIPYWIYSRKETELCSEEILSPVVAPEVECVVCYRSPKGRNTYRDRFCYGFDQVLDFRDQVKRQMEIRSSAYYQRKIMTDSLRYDILKRDGFRCVLCGRSANDGVKLHVDHILPVSRGGKTERDNLRTLCSDCNMGKRDKYDAHGMN